MLLVCSSRFADHVTPPGHPERPERADVFDSVASGRRGRGIETVQPTPALPDQLGHAHTSSHIERIAHTAGRAAMLDPDTFKMP